jgi:predicted nucleotidyltransferase component of viral defense system
MTKDISASVRARLLAIAKEEQSDFNQILVRYALERILYRLSQSQHADRFLLKGALLFNLWYDMPHRATRDADLLGFGASDLDSLALTFRDIAGIQVNDGIIFDPATINIEEIRKEADYTGARILINSEVAKARCKTQIDIGFGDAVTPGPVHATYPVILADFPAPQLRIYPVYTVIAEKLHAITLLGMSNSRLKDYLDLWVILSRETLDHDILAQAIAATFTRREMALPTQLPIGLTDEFANDPSRQNIWLAFLKKNQLSVTPLTNVVALIRTTLQPVLQQATTSVSRIQK